MKRIISALLAIATLCAFFPAVLTTYAEVVPAGTVIVDQARKGNEG